MSANEASASWVVERRAGDVLFQPGDAADCAYVVVAGELELTAGAASVARLGPGDTCGLLALLEGTPQALGARALTDARLLRLEAADVGRVTAEPGLAAQLLRAVARQLEATLRPAPEPAQRPAPEPSAVPERGLRPRLVTEEGGLEFPLPAEGTLLVGRGDPRSGHKPDVDLSLVDTRRSLSRRHARLTRRGEAWLVREEPRAANGTFVNGERLAPGQERELRNGDELLFGSVRTRYVER